MTILKPAKLYIAFSGILVCISLLLLFVPGPRLSIDFEGGTLMEIALRKEVTKADVARTLASIPPSILTLGNVSLFQTREGTMLLRMRDLSNEEHLLLLTQLRTYLGSIEERTLTTIGPTIGRSLRQRSIIALGLAALAIILYLAFSFRDVPRKLSAWKFGIIAVLTLFHDVLVTVGIFVILSHLTSFEVDTLFVTALLTIMGYSVNDTIIIFDRIRENLSLQIRSEPFPVIAERSIHQSWFRCLSTSMTVLIMLLSLLFLGPESIRWFVLALAIGVAIGTYSSIFLATPLLIAWRKEM